jgi:hypothetical protein
MGPGAGTLKDQEVVIRVACCRRGEQRQGILTGVMGHSLMRSIVSQGDNIRPWAAFSCQKPRRTSQSRTTCFRLRPLRTRWFDLVMRAFMTVRIGEVESERSRSRSSTRTFYDADEEVTDFDKPRSRTLMLPSTLRMVMRNRERPLRTSE